MSVILSILSALARLRDLILEEIFRGKIKKNVEQIEQAETPEEKQDAITNVRETIYKAEHTPPPVISDKTQLPNSNPDTSYNRKLPR